MTAPLSTSWDLHLTISTKIFSISVESTRFPCSQSVIIYVDSKQREFGRQSVRCRRAPGSDPPVARHIAPGATIKGPDEAPGGEPVMQTAPPALAELALRLRQLRQQRWPDVRLTQSALAKALGGEERLAAATVSSWESLTAPKLPPATGCSHMRASSRLVGPSRQNRGCFRWTASVRKKNKPMRNLRPNCSS